MVSRSVVISLWLICKINHWCHIFVVATDAQTLICNVPEFEMILSCKTDMYNVYKVMNVLLWCDSYMYARISANCPDVSPPKELLLPASLIGVLSLEYSKRAPTWRSYFNCIKTWINMDYWIKAWTHFIRLRLMMQVLIRQLLQGAAWSESEGFDAEQYTLLNIVVIK